MQITNKMGVQGRFKMTAIRPDGTKRELAPWQDNMVLDLGLDRIDGWTSAENSNSSNLNAWLAVGTGSTPVQATDTQLESEIAQNDSTVSITTQQPVGGPPYYVVSRRTFVFDTGKAAGNLTELGLCQAKYSGSSPPSTYKRWFFSRALIKNEQGQPITVTVLPDEILQVTYELRIYLLDWSDKTYTLSDGTTEYTITVRPYRVGLGGSTSWFDFDSGGKFARIEDYLWGPQWKKGANAIQPAYNQNVNSPGDSVPSEGSTSYTGWGTIRQPLGTRKRTHWMDLRIVRGAQMNIRYVHTMSSPSFNWSFGFSPALDKPIDETLRFEFESAWGRYDG